MCQPDIPKARETLKRLKLVRSNPIEAFSAECVAHGGTLLDASTTGGRGWMATLHQLVGHGLCARTAVESWARVAGVHVAWDDHLAADRAADRAADQAANETTDHRAGD